MIFSQSQAKRSTPYLNSKDTTVVKFLYQYVLLRERHIMAQTKSKSAHQANKQEGG